MTGHLTLNNIRGWNKRHQMRSTTVLALALSLMTSITLAQVQPVLQVSFDKDLVATLGKPAWVT